MVEKTIHRIGPDPGEFTIDGTLPPSRCETCRFWGRAEGGITVCRFNPATPIPMIQNGTITGLFPIYPPKRAHDWCGKHEPKGGHAFRGA